MPAMNRVGVADCRADPVAVAGITRARVVDQPAACAAQRGTVGRPDAVSAQAGAQDLGIFRDFRRRGRQLAAARQRAGKAGVVIAHRTSPTNMGLALLANLTAHDFGYLSCRTARRAHDECAAHDGIAGAPSRPFLQLVRHAHARAADAPIYLDGGQRQSRGTSADAARGTRALADAPIVHLRWLEGLRDTFEALREVD